MLSRFLQRKLLFENTHQIIQRKIEDFESNECMKKFDRIPDLKIDIQTVHEGPQDFYAKNAQRSLAIVISNDT